MKSIFPSFVAAFITLMVIGFDDQKPETAPNGWTVAMTGEGSPQWTVENDRTAPSAPNVLKQAGTASFPLCIKDDISLKDGFAEVKFKPLAGKEDQAAGIVWRYRDPQNYYLVRASALANNVVLCKVEQGTLSSLDIVGGKAGSELKQNVENGKWQKLRVQFVGDRFTVLLDGKRLFQVLDQTFPDAGKVGVCTTADSVTLFDDFSCGKKR
jgi:hypothetical protein